MTSTIKYERLTPENLNEHSLDGFVRHQEVYECWRKRGGEWTLMPVRFTENWDLNALRETAAKLIKSTGEGYAGFGAFDGGKLCGFALIGAEVFDPEERYIALKEMHVSEPYRGRHIGSTLFKLCMDAARERGAHKLYLSAHSSKESQAFYRAMGCVEACSYDAESVRLEPCDVQMEKSLIAP